MMRPTPSLEDLRSVVEASVDQFERDRVRFFVEEPLVEWFRRDHAGRAMLELGLQDGGHGVPISDLTPDGSRRFRRAILLRREFTPVVIDTLADRARQGDEDAGWVLQEHAARLRAQDQPVPEALVRFLDEKRPRRRGRKSGDYEVRNMKILAARDFLVERCGYHATRNSAPKSRKEAPDESACDVLARVLGRAGVNIDARGVEKICERAGRRGAGTRRKKAPHLYNIIGVKIDDPSDL
jgi:hypothetical protein